MAEFIYKNLVNEFKGYLDNNHLESIYFESLRIKNLNDTTTDVTYRDLIRNEKFTTPILLNNDKTHVYIQQLKSIGKVRHYQKYCYHLLDNLGFKSELTDKINSIQAISGNSHLHKRSIFLEGEKEYDNFPVSVKVSFKYFDTMFNNDPFESLNDLLTLIKSEQKNETLYFNFIRYYLSNDNIHTLLLEYTTENQKRKAAQLIAVLYIFFTKGNKFHELSDQFTLINETIQKFSKDIPSELNQEFDIIDSIKSKLELEK